MRMRPLPLVTHSSELFSAQEPRTGLDLRAILNHGLLANPETHSPLRHDDATRSLLDQANRNFRIDEAGRPHLLPLSIQANEVETENHALRLYWEMNKFRAGENNAAQESAPWRLHARRLQGFVRDVDGLTLDVGSDLPSISIQLMSSNCDYIALEPFPSAHSEFCIVGMAEMLPFAGSCLDAVIFNTSLDHILDWRTAIEESHRVLKVGGRLVVATLAWLGKATLLTDDIHFHHFREAEIVDELGLGFAIDDLVRFPDPTGRSHRYGLYVKATKLG